jgi:hypothetical protein
MPPLQLKREWSLWPEFGWIPANLGDFSKGLFAMTFLSSSPLTPATQSALCGLCSRESKKTPSAAGRVLVLSSV